MKINELTECLDGIIINQSLPVSFCNIESGIKFMMPSLLPEAAGTIFLGTKKDWAELLARNVFSEHCTYIICAKDDTPEMPPYHPDINLIFLDTTLRAALHILNLFFSEKILPDSNGISREYLSFWNDILYSRIKTQNQVLERLKIFPYPLKKHIACIVVTSRKKSDSSHIYTVSHSLQKFFPETNLFFTGEEWIILYAQEKDTSDLLDISYENFSELLESLQLDAGISYVCQLPEILRTLYITASAALDLGKGLSIKPYVSRIYTFHQYNPYYIIQMCAQNFVTTHKTENLIYLTHPDITRLYYYDLENGNNLLEVLFSYLMCGKNIGLTAQTSFMHRNTVVNKLNKIDEILTHKLDYEKDHLLLLLSCMILQYQHSYTKHNINDYFSAHDFENDEND